MVCQLAFVDAPENHYSARPGSDLLVIFSAGCVGGIVGIFSKLRRNWRIRRFFMEIINILGGRV